MSLISTRQETFALQEAVGLFLEKKARWPSLLLSVCYNLFCYMKFLSERFYLCISL